MAMGDEARAAGMPCLFERTCLVSANNVCLSARCSLGQRQLIALVMRSGDLTLYYQRAQSGQLPVMKHIPWFVDSNKKIAALCFNPPGNWLVVVSYDGSIFIVPALSLVDPGTVLDHRWSTCDVTSFPSPSAAGCRRGRPTAVAWWQNIQEYRHVVVVGTDEGELSFFNLTGGTQMGTTHVPGPVEALHICEDNSLDSVFLLITSRQRSQWKLLLEQSATKYCWPLEGSSVARQVPAIIESSSGSHNSADVDAGKNSGNSHLPTVRSRLQGLKQLSVEKLAHLKLKLAETRLRNTNNFHVQRELGVENREEVLLGEAVESHPHLPSSGPLPERLSAHVGDTFLCPQYARDRYLLSGYYAPSSILTIHSINIDVVPLFVYKLPPDCCDILVTDRFLFVTNSVEQSVSIVSCHFAESRLDCDMDYNLESVVGTFEFSDSERVLALYKQGSASQSRQNYTRNLIKEGPGRGHKKASLQFVLSKSAAEVKVDSPPVDSCIIVTTHGIYLLALRRPASEVFMELVLERQQLETAERVALMFGLPLQELLEHAGDLKLAAKDFPQAIALYKLSRCSHLKSVLKFAAGGHSTELLGFITLLFSTTGLDLTTAERIHLSNLAVMSHTEQLLRATVSKAVPFKQFLKFLQNNLFYDEVLAVNVAGQTGLWEVLQFLASHRGLHQEVLDIVSTVLCTLVEGLAKPAAKNSASRFAPLLDAGLWMCVSDPTLLPALLAKPQHCKVHLQFVTMCLPHLEQFALQRLAALYDPSSPLLRPGLRRMLCAPRAPQGSGSYSYFSDSTQATEATNGPADEGGGVPLQDMIQKFLLVLLYLTRKLVSVHVFIPQLISDVQPPSSATQVVDDLSLTPLPIQATSLSAGFGHVALIRNGTAHTWGSAIQGCLGTGPTLSHYGSAQPITFFPSLKLEVLSVSCGRLHTIALTDNGVFTWGSSQYGQLGVGRTGRSSRPRLVEGLCRERVAAVSAGQYHSLALTSDGRVYSWGWGVHGQLGHGSVEDLHRPAHVCALSGKVVVQVCGGYAHSLALTADGRVFSFGSSMFGQLGHGSTTKSSIPVPVTALHETIRIITTAYFHNLAVSTTNKLYVWGSSPQVLRVQAQAQKKARLLHHQPFTLLNGPELTGMKSLSRQLPSPRPRLEADDEASTTDFSSAINYSHSDFEVISDAPVGDVPCTENGQELPPASKTTVEAVVENSHPIADDMILPFPDESAEPDMFTDSGNMFGSPEVLEGVLSSQGVQYSEDVFQTGQQNGNCEKAKRPPENLLLNGDLSQVSCTPQRISGGNGMPRLSELKGMKGPDVRNNLHLKAMLSGVVSTEDYVMQSVVSPTMEFKGLTATPSNLTTGSNHAKVLNGSPHLGQPDGLDDGQSHLVPQLVDTSLVTGEILQVSCGCHHSALLSAEEVLYMWGRNLDGQVGNGTRKEVPLPTPLSFAAARCPPPSSRSGGSSKLNISGVIPGGSDRLRVQRVSCGCEFSVALDSSGKVWAWGSNASGQLGKPPNEESRALEGKLFMLKTTKRVIKLPHGSSNSSDTPKEVLGIPTSTISFKYGVFPNQIQGFELSDVCPPLSTLEKPSYGPVTLHYVMQRFHGFYNSNYILSKCVELENYQTAAKLAALDRNYPVALSYQLKALALAIPESILRADERSAEENLPEKESDEVKFVDNRTSQDDQKNGFVAPMVNNSSQAISRESQLVKEDETTNGHGGTVNAESQTKIKNSGITPGLISSNQFGSVEKCNSDDEYVSNKGSAMKSSPVKFVNSVESSKPSVFPVSVLKCQEDGGQVMKVGASSGDGLQDEIHAFAVEGGKEQLFEVGQGLSSPDSVSSLVNTPLSAVDSGSNTQPNSAPQHIDKKTDKLAAGRPNRKSSDLQLNKSSRLSLKLDLQNAMNVVKKVENYSNGASPCGDVLSHDRVPKLPCLSPFPSNLVPGSMSTPRTSADDASLPTFTTLSSGAISLRGSPLDSDQLPGPVQENGTPAQFVVTNYKDLMLQASVIVEYYVSIMEEDSHAMMNKLLNKGIEFWLQHSLPMDTLENLLLKHMSKFFYPLGLLMFCQRPGCEQEEEVDGRTAAVLSSLSSRFSLQLCFVLLSYLQQKKQCPEYVEELARYSAGGASPSEDKSQEQMMEEVFQNLGVYGRPGEPAMQPCIRFKDVSVLKQGGEGGEAVEQLFVFSCGHHHSADSLRQELDTGLHGLSRPLPNTARMLKEVFSPEAPSLQLACPSCVLAYLHQQADPP